MPPVEVHFSAASGDAFSVEIDDEEDVESLAVLAMSMRPDLGEELHLSYRGVTLQDSQQVRSIGYVPGELVGVTAKLPAPASSPVAAALDANAEVVSQLCSMGFPSDQVLAALQAAFNNPDRAVEYLFNGIPAAAQTSMPGAPTPTQAAPAAPAPTPVPAPAQVPAPTPVAAGPSPLPIDDAAADAALLRLAEMEHEAQEVFFKTGLKVLENVLQNPEEPKFRQLKRTNPALSAKFLDAAGSAGSMLVGLAGFETVSDEFLALAGPPDGRCTAVRNKMQVSATSMWEQHARQERDTRIKEEMEKDKKRIVRYGGGEGGRNVYGADRRKKGGG